MKDSMASGQSFSSSLQQQPSWLAKCRGWCAKWFGGDKAIGFIALVLVIGGLWRLGAGYGILPSPDFPAATAGKWQSVFLVNNQVYFGHIKNYNSGYAALEDVYYLQVTQALQPPVPGEPPQLNLVKLGSELHGPEDRIFVPKERILFWENMKNDSQVVQAIESTRK